MKVERVPISSLVLDPDNARYHNQQNLDAIRGSLEAFGQVEPLVVRRKSNIVLGGNGRLTVMQELGYTECSVHFVDFDDKKAKALALALNRTPELAAWDQDRLGIILHELREEDFDISSIGFDDSELEETDSWETDIDDAKANVDKVDANLDGITSTVKVTCPQEEKERVIASIKAAVSDIEGVSVGG